jgi:hypothetical protein
MQFADANEGMRRWSVLETFVRHTANRVPVICSEKQAGLWQSRASTISTRMGRTFNHDGWLRYCTAAGLRTDYLPAVSFRDEGSEAMDETS